VTRVDISHGFTLAKAIVFPATFAVMLLCFVWKALNGEVSSVVVGLPADFPDWGKWLILVGLAAVISWVCWQWATLKHVALVDDQLLIRSLTASARVPLSQVASIEWTQRPDDSDTAEAMIVLCVPTAVGTHITFEPKSAEAFELLRSKVEGR
jgi:hypothetical protein